MTPQKNLYRQRMKAFEIGLNGKYFRVILIAFAIFMFISFLFRNDTEERKINDNTIKKKLTENVDDLTMKVDFLEMKLKEVNFGLLRLATRSNDSGINIDNLTSFPVKSFWTDISGIKKLSKTNHKHKANDNVLSSPIIIPTTHVNTRPASHKTFLMTDFKCDMVYKVLVLVTTHSGHFNKRSVIRNTWGYDAGQRWKTVFLVGSVDNDTIVMKLQEEFNTYHDIIQTDIYEDFYNLTEKVQAGFEWSLKYCDYKYLLKADDDVFINIPRLFEFLENPEIPRTDLYTGNVQYQAEVFRSGRYGVKKKEFGKKIYPRYCSGGGYILSRDSVTKMLNVIDRVKSIKIDDAYVGELALKAGIDVIHEGTFRMFEDAKKCEYNKDWIVHHPVITKKCMEKLFLKSLEED